MALPTLSGEFRVAKDPALSFTSNGKARLKLTVVANDRKQDGTGNWVDGDPWWGDVIVWGKHAENLAEVVVKGTNVVIANARCEQYKFEAKDGSGERTGSQYVADAIGVSHRWASSDHGKAVAAVSEVLGGEEVGPAPF